MQPHGKLAFFKNAIKNKIGVKKDVLRLSLNGQPLEDFGKTFHELGIFEGTVVQLRVVATPTT